MRERAKRGRKQEARSVTDSKKGCSLSSFFLELGSYAVRLARSINSQFASGLCEWVHFFQIVSAQNIIEKVFEQYTRHHSIEGGKRMSLANHQINGLHPSVSRDNGPINYIIHPSDRDFGQCCRLSPTPTCLQPLSLFDNRVFETTNTNSLKWPPSIRSQHKLHATRSPIFPSQRQTIVMSDTPKLPPSPSEFPLIIPFLIFKILR